MNPPERSLTWQAMSEARVSEDELSWREYSERVLALLDEFVQRLRQAGAGAPGLAPDPAPTHIHAVGPRVERRAEVVIPRLASGATAGEVLRRAIASSVVRLVQHDAMIRLDAGPEGVHQARVATRRLRSDLRTFGPLLDREWAAGLRSELGWLAPALGVVRDSDVMLERMRTRTAELKDGDARAAAPVVATLETARGEAYAGLLGTLRGARYRALLDRLVAAANTPALQLEADLPASTVLPSLVQRPWRRLSRRVKALGDEPTDEELHAVRIEAKRVRYAAEAAAPLLGGRARAFARAAAALQEVLGDLNDAVVAEAWLRGWAQRSRPAPAAFAAGELAGLERAAAQQARARWRRAWKELSSPRLRSWI